MFALTESSTECRLCICTVSSKSGGAQAHAHSQPTISERDRPSQFLVERTSMHHKRPRILVVDDEAANTSSLVAILDKQGYETATANSGEEAIQIAGVFQPDLIVSDIIMGAMNGVEAAIEVARVLPHCKVLFISGYVACGDLLAEASAKGINFDVLPMPFFVPELLAIAALEALNGIGGRPPKSATVAAPKQARGGRRRVSAAGGARIAAAAKAMWARRKKAAAAASKPAVSKKAAAARHMSAATRKRLSKLAKQRWAAQNKAAKAS